MEKLGRNDHCWCGSGKKYKGCHMALDEKIHRYELAGHIVPSRDLLKSREQIEGTEMLLVPGLVFTIEPMVNMGTSEIYIDDKDNWTVYTQDGRPSAQWEITVAVTEDGCEVLTY